MAPRRQTYWQGRARRRHGWLETVPLLPLLLVAAGVGGAATLGLSETGVASWLLDRPPVTTTASRTFGPCVGGSRHTCVVDGDTFWLDGQRIRIADINTPETGQPQCAAEAELGRRAALRLTELLNAGPFALAPIDRDEDQYGRKLRIVERNGRSLGSQLVAEGLAHEWRGRREGWC